MLFYGCRRSWACATEVLSKSTCQSHELEAWDDLMAFRLTQNGIRPDGIQTHSNWEENDERLISTTRGPISFQSGAAFLPGARSRLSQICPKSLHLNSQVVPVVWRCRDGTREEWRKVSVGSHGQHLAGPCCLSLVALHPQKSKVQTVNERHPQESNKSSLILSLSRYKNHKQLDVQINGLCAQNTSLAEPVWRSPTPYSLSTLHLLESKWCVPLPLALWLCGRNATPKMTQGTWCGDPAVSNPLIH